MSCLVSSSICLVIIMASIAALIFLILLNIPGTFLFPKNFCTWFLTLLIVASITVRALFDKIHYMFKIMDLGFDYNFVSFAGYFCCTKVIIKVWWSISICGVCKLLCLQLGGIRGTVIRRAKLLCLCLFSF